MKYLFKYLHKGALLELHVECQCNLVSLAVAGTAVQYATINMLDTDEVDEPEEYIAKRSLCSAEAFWRMFGMHSHWKSPSVECLDLHMPGGNSWFGVA